MAQHKQILILQLRIAEHELNAIINPQKHMSPPQQRVTLTETSVTRKAKTDELMCGWCTLPIRGTPLGIPVSQDLKTNDYRTTHSFHHPRCVAAGAKYHYPHKIDPIMKLVRELYGHNILPADPKEIMARFTRGGITDEEYESRLKDTDHLSRTIYPPMISPLTAELFSMSLV